MLCEKYYLPYHESTKKFSFEEKIVKFSNFLISFFIGFLDFLSFAGGTLNAFFKSLSNPKLFRPIAIAYHVEQAGLKALPIISITSLLIGVVIAFQGAVQLEKFGANIFISELVFISATRELAPLLSAIVIAGRSASAYSAEIGVMKITDEVDAMKTMGFNPWNFLVLPRVCALVITMPLLVVFADMVCVFGGMIVAQSVLDVSFFEFISRIHDSLLVNHFLIGLIKAPFFGYIISIIGCYRGFQITKSTESVGKFTTISVVNAIFWVIAFDAIFSIFLTKLGL